MISMPSISRRDAGPDVCNVRGVQELASQAEAIISSPTLWGKMMTAKPRSNSPTMWRNAQWARQKIVELYALYVVKEECQRRGRSICHAICMDVENVNPSSQKNIGRQKC